MVIDKSFRGDLKNRAFEHGDLFGQPHSRVALCFFLLVKSPYWLLLQLLPSISNVVVEPLFLYLPVRLDGHSLDRYVRRLVGQG